LVKGNSSEPKPLVSVIVSTYRRDDLLTRALKSLSAQTYDNTEIVVVDDNGDSEWNKKVNTIVENIKKDCRFPLVLKTMDENKGAPAARNQGIDAASGEYITFLDDDDVYMEEKIERQTADMTAADADYGLTDLYLYNAEEKLVDSRTRPYLKQTDPDSLLRYHILYHMTGTDTLMFKADYLREIGGFPPINVGDEYYMMIEAITRGGKICYSPECYVKAYVHSGETTGLSSGYGKIEGENNLYRAKEQYLDRLSKSEVKFVKVRHWAVLAYAYLRMKHYPEFFGCAAKAVMISPSAALKIRKNH